MSTKREKEYQCLQKNRQKYELTLCYKRKKKKVEKIRCEKKTWIWQKIDQDQE